MATDSNGSARTPLDQLRDANDLLVVSAARAQELAERVDASRLEAEAASRRKDELMAVVSHEPRTPLNAIRGWARLLSRGRLNAARTATAIQTIERNADGLLSRSSSAADRSGVARARHDGRRGR